MKMHIAESVSKQRIKGPNTMV